MNSNSWLAHWMDFLSFVFNEKFYLIFPIFILFHDCKLKFQKQINAKN